MTKSDGGVDPFTLHGIGATSVLTMTDEVGKSHRLAGPLCIPRAVRRATELGWDLQAYDFIHLGGDDRDRTDDLSVANAALSQLSYVPAE